MNYIAAITTLFQCSSHRLSERSKVLDVDFDFAVTSLPKYEQITELIESFPQRDIVTLSLINENDDLFYMSSQDLSLQQKFDTFKTDCKYSEQLSAKISINKSVQDGNISIYDFSSFAQGLCDLPLEGILSTFSALLSEANQLTFEVFDKEVLFKTKTMLFSSAPQKVVFKAFDRKHRLSTCSETTHFHDQVRYQLLPDDFQLDINFEGNPLSEIFNRLVNILSLVYLSSSASLNHEILEIHIAGQRILEFQYQCSLIAANPELYKIYNWIYTDGNATDKALIARNILCLHCRFSDIQKIDGKTFASIQSNYNLYLKDNVSRYIQLTNKLAEFISEVVSKTGDYVTSLLDDFKKNLIAILGFLFTVILANPLICNAENIHAVSAALKNVQIVCGDYSESKAFIDKHTLVYLDPPYRPLKGRDSFISYTETEFDDSCQRALAGFIEEINARGAYIILSNSDPKNVDPEDDFFEDLYIDYDVQRIQAKRRINRNADHRGYITELLIKNY